MELRNGPVSIFKIVFYALKVSNQAFGTVLALMFLMVAFIALLSVICFGVSTLINNPLGLTAISLPLPLLTTFLEVVFTVATVYILAARFEKRGTSAYESFRDCLVPAIYFIISSLLVGIVFYALLFGLMQLSSLTIKLVGGLLLCLLLLPFCFTIHAIALRNEGPLSALRYSWDLVTRHYWRMLWNIFCLGLMGLFVILAVFSLCKALLSAQYAAFASPHGLAALQTLAPLWLLQQPKLYIILGSIILVLLYLYFCLFVQAVWTGLFLNLDYADRPVQSRDLDAQEGFTSRTVLPDVGIKQTSVQTSTDEATASHMEQVYNAQDHLAQALQAEEDRMPTILFDEDMAKELAENEEKMRRHQEEASQKKDLDEQKSIKISDKTL